MNQDANNNTTPNFEEALARLDEIARALEDNRQGLQESLAVYEEGVKLLRHCQGLLQNAERRIELLTGVDTTGNPVTVPFDDTATFQQTTTFQQTMTQTAATQPTTKPARKKAAKKTASDETLAAPWEETTEEKSPIDDSERLF